MKFPTLLIATDLLPKTDPAIARAARIATTLAADVSILHVLSTEARHPDVTDQTVESIERLNGIAGRERWPSRQPITAMVRAGVPANVIIEAAAELRPDLLVLGPHATRGVRERITTVFGGTIAERTLAARVCPVLVARERPQEAYQRILIALDLSTTAISAIRAAESLVMGPHADVSVLHAAASPYMGSVESTMGAARGMSARHLAAWRSRATVSVRTLLRQASTDFSRYGIQIEDRPPARAILEAMHAQEPDLLVLGTSGRGPWGRALIGSVANEVLGEAWCDVLVVPDVTQTQGRFVDEETERRTDREAVARTRWL